MSDRPSHLVRRLLLGVALAGAAVVAIWAGLDRPAPPDLDQPAVTNAPDAPGAVNNPGRVEPPRGGIVQTRPSGSTENDDGGLPANTRRLALEQRVATEPDLPLTQTTLAGSWSHADYSRATSNPDQIDGETAFAAYEFVRECVGQPRTDQQFEFRLEMAGQYFDDNRRRVSENRFNRAVDRLQDRFVQCQLFTEPDLVQVAADWLMLAADLEYLPAQVRFYTELPALLRETRARVFAVPAYLDLHREKSIEYLDRALQSGHPRAFLAMGIAISDGVIFEPDPLAAAAYLEAADLAAHGLDPQIGELKVRLNQELSPAQQTDARHWGADLCRRYCRLTD